MTNIYQSFTNKMAAEINWHRCGTKLRHCRPMYRMRGGIVIINRGGSRRGVTRVTSHPPARQPISCYYYACDLSYFDVVFCPSSSPDPLNARSLHSLGFPKSPPPSKKSQIRQCYKSGSSYRMLAAVWAVRREATVADSKSCRRLAAAVQQRQQ